MLVLAGFTDTTRRPALSALAVRMFANCAQPASRIDLLRPALAVATFGRNAPALSGSGFGAGRRVMPATLSFSRAITSQVFTRARAALWWKSRRRFRTFRHSFASWRRIRLRFPDPRRARSLRRCRSALTSAEAARNFGLATISPSEVSRTGRHPHRHPRPGRWLGALQPR